MSNDSCKYCNSALEDLYKSICHGCRRLLDKLPYGYEISDKDAFEYVTQSHVVNGELLCGVCRNPAYKFDIDMREDGSVRGVLHSGCLNILAKHRYDVDSLLNAAAAARREMMEEDDAS